MIQDRINETKRKKDSLTTDTARLTSELELYSLTHRTAEQTLKASAPLPKSTDSSKTPASYF